MTEQPITAVNVPVKLLLTRDHAGPGVLMLHSRGNKPLSRRDACRTHRRRLHSAQPPRQLIQLPSGLKRQVRWKRKLLQFCSSELVEPLPASACNTTALSAVSLVVTDLLEPGTRGRAVEDNQHSIAQIEDVFGAQPKPKHVLICYSTTAVNSNLFLSVDRCIYTRDTS